MCQVRRRDGREKAVGPDGGKKAANRPRPVGSHHVLWGPWVRPTTRAATPWLDAFALCAWRCRRWHLAARVWTVGGRRGCSRLVGALQVLGPGGRARVFLGGARAGGGRNGVVWFAGQAKSRSSHRHSTGGRADLGKPGQVTAPPPQLAVSRSEQAERASRDCEVNNRN